MSNLVTNEVLPRRVATVEHANVHRLLKDVCIFVPMQKMALTGKTRGRKWLPHTFRCTPSISSPRAPLSLWKRSQSKHLSLQHCVNQHGNVWCALECTIERQSNDCDAPCCKR